MARTINQALQNKRRNQILEAAAECFTEKGFHQTGMKEICHQAGLSAGTVYHYFENKEAIIAAIALEFSSDTEKFFNTLQKNKNFSDGFIKASKARLKETQKNIKYGRLVVDIYAESFRNHKVKEILQQLDNEAHMALKNAITKAMVEGQISTTHNPEMLSHTLIAIIEGLENRILQHPDIKLTHLLKPFEALIRKLLQTA